MQKAMRPFTLIGVMVFGVSLLLLSGGDTSQRVVNASTGGDHNTEDEANWFDGKHDDSHGNDGNYFQCAVSS